MADLLHFVTAMSLSCAILLLASGYVDGLSGALLGLGIYTGMWWYEEVR